MYGITSQMRRAAVSVGANLAEGCGRRTSTELARFLRLAMGSASELDYHLLLGFMKADDFDHAATGLTEVRKMLTSFLSTVKKQIETQGKVQSKAAGTT